MLSCFFFFSRRFNCSRSDICLPSNSFHIQINLIIILLVMLFIVIYNTINLQLVFKSIRNYFMQNLLGIQISHGIVDCPLNVVLLVSQKLPLNLLHEILICITSSIFFNISVISERVLP